MSIPSFDSSQYKAGQRREWGVSADGWKRHWKIWEQAAQHLNERLVDLARIRPVTGYWTLRPVSASQRSLRHAE